MKKKGFTLIELLAVIIILAVVALIATPLILDVIDDAEKSANKSQVELLLGAAENMYAQSYLDESLKSYLDVDNIYGNLKTSGELPPNGKLLIQSDGKIQLSVFIDDVCYTKGLDDTSIQVLEGEGVTAESCVPLSISVSPNQNLGSGWFGEDVVLTISSNGTGYKYKLSESAEYIVVNETTGSITLTETTTLYAIPIRDGVEGEEVVLEYKIDRTVPVITVKDSNPAVMGSGVSVDVLTYFDTNIDSTNGKVTCKVGNTEVTNTSSLAEGTNEIICTARSFSGKEASATKIVSIGNFMITGQEFNTAVKALGGYSTATSLVVEDSITEGYTNASSSYKADVSMYDDESVVVWVDGNTIRVQSNGNIMVNPDAFRMFFDFDNLTSIDLGTNFDTRNVINTQGMFSLNYLLENLNLGSKFHTSQVTNMQGMFSHMPNLINFYLGENFDTSKVTNMQSMFQELESLTSLNLGEKFNTLNVTDMSSMFERTLNLENLNLGTNFNTINVIDMKEMFAYMNSLSTLNLGEKFNTINVDNMQNMFKEMSSLISLDLGNKFDTSNVGDGVNNNNEMSYMFHGMYNLTSLNLGDKFDTKNVVNMTNMFWGLNKLSTLNLGEKFDTSNVVYMSNMFDNLKSLTDLNLGDKFNTSNVVVMTKMFFGMTSLTKLDLGASFIMPTGVSKDSMFQNTGSSETTIYVPNSTVESAIKSGTELSSSITVTVK